jgi:phage terminase large subunit-like protein
MRQLCRAQLGRFLSKQKPMLNAKRWADFVRFAERKPNDLYCPGATFLRGGFHEER